MRRNCNLELRLLPPSTDYNHHHLQPKLDLSSGISKERQQQQQQQEITIFYNGRVSICEVTELQAKSIIMLASREMEEKMKSLLGTEPSSPLPKSPLCSPSTGLFMKRSLQGFLQKRRNRIQATSPYHR
ncbi:jasmonate-zim-domain protein 8 [Actinidia rufa]|uniref:Protein TIFY n=1 Tax=Actinidia rufa TaxID=165716 RepID=A0A7J0ER16_9ERIC|nr:jasmonate-zim-domain protein 8 [Actinidia rufa]